MGCPNRLFILPMSPLMLLTLGVSALYGWIAWRLHHARDDRWVHRLLPVALLGHGALSAHAILGQGDIRLGFASSLSTVVGLTAVAYWLASRSVPLARAQAWVSALAALAVLGMALFPAAHAIPNSEALALRAHLLVSFLAYALLAMAALHAVLMTMLEKRLHRGSLLHDGAPPLLTLEAMLFRTIGAGFALLTLAVFSGMFFSKELFGVPLRFTHMVVFGILSWLVFAGLLLGRHYRGWRGRTALVWTMTGFILLLLAYLGTQFVLEFVLRR